MTRHQSIAMLPSTAGVFVNGCVATGMFSAANLSAPSADRPAAIASSCWASCSSETLNSREAWMSRVVRDPGCWAIATIAGLCDTYITVPVEQDRSSPSAAPMIATG